MNWIKTKVEGLDQANPTVLLKINIAIFLFVALANGLPLVLLEKEKLLPGFAIGYLTVPVTSVAASLAVVSLFNRQFLAVALKAHTFLLLFLAAYMLHFSISTILAGIPSGANFSWNPLLFGFVLAYPVYLARRFVLPQHLLQSFFIRYSHIAVFTGSLFISAAIVSRVFGQT